MVSVFVDLRWTQAITQGCTSFGGAPSLRSHVRVAVVVSCVMPFICKKGKTYEDMEKRTKEHLLHLRVEVAVLRGLTPLLLLNASRFLV